MNSCWPYAAIFSFFCAKLCTNMPRSTCRRLVQKKKWETHVFFLRKRLNTTDLSEGLWLVGTHFFGASATPRSFTKKTGYLTLFHCSWRSAWYQICDIWSCYCMRHSWLTKFGVLCLNQLVHTRWSIAVAIERAKGGGVVSQVNEGNEFNEGMEKYWNK